MDWKIWKKKPTPEAGKPAEAGKPPQPQKLPGPREMPEPVGRYLVVQLNKDPDWAWALKAVVRPRAESKSAFEIRVFDEGKAAARKIPIRNYTTLDSHPELILFQGWYDRKSREVHLEETNVPAPRAA